MRRAEFNRTLYDVTDWLGGVALAAAAAAFGLTFLLDRTVIGKKYAAKIIEILPGNKESDDDTKEKVQH